jgi:uroporphyrinogen decarboxylase
MVCDVFYNLFCTFRRFQQFPCSKMARMNMNNWRNQLMTQKSRAAMPIATHPGIEMIGKHVLDAVTDGEIHFQAVQALAKEYPSAAAVTMMDLTVEAEAFGSAVSFSAHEVPVVTGRIVSDYESVLRLTVPDMMAGRLQKYIKASRLAAEHIRTKPVFGGCIGPFSLAGRLFDMTEIMTAAYLEPETVISLLEKCTLFLHQYLGMLKGTGINGIIMAEPAAGLLDESLCDTFSSAYIKRLVETFQDDYFHIFLHNCGNTGHVTRSMISTGAQGLHFGNRMDMKAALKEVPGDILVAGNIDPVGIFKMATPREVADHTTALLDAARGYPNFIISSGCDTPPGVPVANIRAFYDAVAAFNSNQ